MTKIRVSNDQLPGVMAEGTISMGSEIHREEITFEDQYLGTIVYVRRVRTTGGSEYGWRPDRAHPNTKLTGKIDAILRLRVPLGVRLSWPAQLIENGES